MAPETSRPGPADLPLRALVKEPSRLPPAATLVLLHGRGSDPEDFASAAEPLQGDDLRIVSLQAPFPAPGGGWMWYGFTEKGVDRETMMASMRAIDKMTGAYCVHVPAAPPAYMAGFSQGATASLAFATLRPERVEGVVALSGFLIEDSLLPGPVTNLKGKKIFMSHGRADRAVPLAWAQAAKARLESAGAHLEFTTHAGGHFVPHAVWAEAREWILNDLMDSRGGPLPR